MAINDIISNYVQARAERLAAEKTARDAKKREEVAAAEIIRHAAGRPGFDTDAWTVAIEQATRIILDQEKLFRDFPGIKALDQYGKESTRDVITALARQAASTPAA